MNKKEETKKDSVCMACTCPCEEHQTHTCGVNVEHGNKCDMCGHTHKSDGTCDCGCK